MRSTAEDGLAFAPGGHMGVITPSCMLLCTTLGSRLILGEPLTASRIAGAVAILLGLVALGWDGLANHGELTWLGDAMFALGGLFWASYTIGSRVWRVDPLHATAVVGVLSMVLYLPAYAWFAGTELAAAPWREIVIQAVFQGVLSAIKPGLEARIARDWPEDQILFKDLAANFFGLES